MGSITFAGLVALGALMAAGTVGAQDDLAMERAIAEELAWRAEVERGNLERMGPGIMEPLAAEVELQERQVALAEVELREAEAEMRETQSAAAAPAAKAAAGFEVFGGVVAAAIAGLAALRGEKRDRK